MGVTGVATIGEAIAAAAQGDGATIHPPWGWMQGRTYYGGISAMLAFAAARGDAPDLPALRSAQVAYVAPLAGDLTVSVNVIRRGKRAAFISADVLSDGVIGLRGLFVFMEPTQSALTHDEGPAPAFVQHEAAVNAVPPAPEEYFVHRFDMRHAAAENEPGRPEFYRWVRVRDRDGLDPHAELILLGDALPPAAIRISRTPAPISTLTWNLNIATPLPRTREGWWLVAARADYAAEGCSSQTMRVWDADGALVATGIQNVAIFG